MSTSKTKIPYGYHYLDEEDIEAVVDVLRKGPITQGSVVQEFGKALSSYSGAKYCVPVSSGTAALHLSLAALDIGPGAEVITTPLTFCATANVVLHQGAIAELGTHDSLLSSGGLYKEIYDLQALHEADAIGGKELTDSEGVLGDMR